MYPVVGYMNPNDSLVQCLWVYCEAEHALLHLYTGLKHFGSENRNEIQKVDKSETVRTVLAMR